MWWWVAAASGFVTLALEVLYTRLFALVLHNSTYTFGAVVAVFLAGLALGAVLVAALGRRVSPRALAAGAHAQRWPSADLGLHVREEQLSRLQAPGASSESRAAQVALASALPRLPMSTL